MTPVIADAVVELLRALDRVLSGHRVGDEEDLDRLHLVLDPLQLFHQRVVDVQTAGRVDHQRVEADLLAVQPRRAAQLERVVDALAREDRNVDRLADDRQLVARRRAVDVDREQQRVAVLILLQPLRQLAGRGRLTRALQSDDHDRVRAARGEEQSARRAAEHLDHLVVDDLDDLLPGRELMPAPPARRPSPLTRSMKSLTTLKLTSASSSAMRISRIARSRCSARQPAFAAQVLENFLELV